MAQEELNTFLAVAEELRVKGLTQGNSNSDNKPKSEAKQPRSNPPELPPPKRQRPAPVVSAATYQDDDEIQEVVPVKSEPAAADNSGYNLGSEGGGGGGQQGTVALEDGYNEESYDYGQYGGEGGYDDGSGMIDPNTGMPLVGADGNKGKNLPLYLLLRSLHFFTEVQGRKLELSQPTSEFHLLSLSSASY